MEVILLENIENLGDKVSVESVFFAKPLTIN